MPDQPTNPTDQAALRDRIAEAVQPLLMDTLPKVIAAAHAREVADAVLPLLPPPADRAAVLREAAEALRTQGKRLAGEFNDSDVLHEDGPAATVATWKRAAEMLRRMADETPAAGPLPRRGDAFEAWLKAQRNRYNRHGESSEFWHEFDRALDEYRLHADMGVPLDGHVCEAKVIGDCECLEQSATGARQDGAR